MTTILPFWWRWAAIGIIGGLLWVHGYTKGREAGLERLYAFQSQVQAEGEKAQARAAEKVVEQKQITEKVSNDYAANIIALRRYYANRVRVKPSPPSGQMPAVPKPSVSSDASSAYSELAGACAETTQQLISLQEWVRQQAK